MVMDQQPEIYPSPTAQFVVFDVRYPTALFLERQEGQEAIYERLSDGFPLLQTVNTLQFPLMAPGAAGAPLSMPGIPSATPSIKMLNRDRTRSATLGSTALQVEISAYQGFEDFAASIRQVLQAVAEVGTVQGIEHLSLRYIDEIRVPGLERTSEWGPYLDDRLLGPTLFPEFRVTTASVTAEYDLGGGFVLELRAAAMPKDAPPAVNPGGPLRLRTSGLGPYFLLDMTGAWKPPDAELPRFVVDDVLAQCDRLHDPLHDMFEAAITDRLRDEVLRREEA